MARNETFGRLLKAGVGSIGNTEDKTASVIEDELGQQIGLAGTAIQRYKAGHLPPDPRTVAILAEACVTRGFLGREWLQRFLHAARYPFAEQLLDQLCPVGPERPRPPRVYENLPAPTYSQFVMRTQAFAAVVDGLQQRSAAVLIVGLGGNGKTSLAREVAAHCLQKDSPVPQFDAVVWVSDKDRPGTTNLSIVLDAIARTLDYPGFTQFEHDEKRREVEQLLKRQKVLLVVDNFETITDGALLAWLLRLPEPSKALITSREKHRALWGSWLAELRGMSVAEAAALIAQRLRALQLGHIAGDPCQFEPLITVTGGNPKAIEMALGLIKHERRPLQQIVDDLYAARGELFDDLFTRAWALLDEAARRVLLVMTFFPASASGAALAATADVQGFAFDRAVERLTDLALLDVQQEDLTTPPRYALHSLVRAFAGARLAEQPELERSARERWVGWYVAFVSQVGYCWNNVERLDIIDPEQATIDAVVAWVNRYYNQGIELSTLAQSLDYYYFVRGFWDKKLEVNRISIAAAHNLADYNTATKARAQLVHMLCRQREQHEALQHLMLLPAIDQAADLPTTISGEVIFAHVLYAISFEDAWDHIQKQCQILIDSQAGRRIDYYNAGKRYLARCLFRQGCLLDAQRVYFEALTEAEAYNDQRAVIACHFGLAEVHLHQNDLTQAEVHASAGYAVALRYQERRYLAHIHHLSARLHTLRGDLPAARAALTEAIDLFERLGMRRELAEARQALADLDARAGEAATG